MKRIILALLVLTAHLLGQDTTCNSGDVAWVSSAVNADVGLAAGAGRCLANTVAGGNYNDPNVPFGIQGAIDCGCAGLEIRVRGDTGNYGSATNSWNNRFDASKEIVMSLVTGTPQVIIVGYADTSTSCADIATVGCPVTMNFNGGTDDGWLLQQRHELAGIHIEDPTNDCVEITGAEIILNNNEMDTCGADGVNVSGGGGDLAIIRNYIHDTTSQGIFTNAQDITIMWNELVDLGNVGIEVGQFTQFVSHNIVNGTTLGDCVEVESRGAYVVWNTLRNCAGDGIDIGTGGQRDMGSFAFNILADNGGWGINDVAQAGRDANVVISNRCDGNASGCINTTNVNETVVGLIEDNITQTITFVSATNSALTAGGNKAFTWPRGLTTQTLDLGAIPSGP